MSRLNNRNLGSLALASKSLNGRAALVARTQELAKELGTVAEAALTFIRESDRFSNRFPEPTMSRVAARFGLKAEDHTPEIACVFYSKHFAAQIEGSLSTVDFTMDGKEVAGGEFDAGVLMIDYAAAPAFANVVVQAARKVGIAAFIE